MKLIKLLTFVVIILNMSCTENSNPINQTQVEYKKIKIVSPIPKSNSLPGDSIQFVCEISNISRVKYNDSDIVWMSDKDGIIGYGDSIVSNNLSDNIHVITVNLQIENRKNFADSIQILVQEKSYTWEGTIGGELYDRGESVVEMYDGSILVTGFTESFSSNQKYDVLLLKYSSRGDLIWQKTFGGDADDIGNKIISTSDGGFLVAGYITFLESYPSRCVYLIKLDSQGETEWEKSVSIGYNSTAESVCETFNGDFLITGSAGLNSEDVLLCKTDKFGNLLWFTHFGGNKMDRGFSVIETSKKEIFISGFTFSYGAGGSDAYVIKTDSTGNQIWENTYGGEKEEGYSSTIIELQNGQFLVTGFTGSSVFESAILNFLSINSDGMLNWTKAIDGAAVSYGHQSIELKDSNVITVGRRIKSGTSGYKYYLLKTDVNGNKIWEHDYGFQGTNYGLAVDVTLDGGFVLVGGTKLTSGLPWNIKVVKTDSLGNTF